MLKKLGKEERMEIGRKEEGEEGFRVRIEKNYGLFPGSRESTGCEGVIKDVQKRIQILRKADKKHTTRESVRTSRSK